MNANTLRSRKGFTLIELMIVVVIIGILAAIAIPRFAGVGQQARQAEAEPILAQIHTLQEAHYERYNRYADGASVETADTPTGLARVGYTAPTGLQHFVAPNFTGGTDDDAAIEDGAATYCVEMAGVTASGTQTMSIRSTRPTPVDNDGQPRLGGCGA